MLLEYRLVELPLLSPFTTSFGTQTVRRALIFELRSNGVTAYSECVTDEEPHYSYEDNYTALHIIRDHLVKLVSDLPKPEEFLRRASAIKGHNMAKAALEMLLWDYHAKLENKPLYKFLGETKGYADVGISIGMDEPKNMVERVGEALNKGYKRVKVKIAKGKELKIVEAIRSAYPDAPLSVDANCDYTLSDFHILKALDQFHLLYIEQPLEHDDLIHHSKLAKLISTPICLDESITSTEKCKKAFEIGAARVVNIKPGRVAGLFPSLEIAKIARSFGGHVWVGGMLETGVGRSFNISFASLSLVDYPGDTSLNEKYFEKDIVLNPFKMVNGRITPNHGAGIGIEVDYERLERVTKTRGTLLEVVQT
jgi:O-succinylbenzoate synthase